MSTIQRGPAPSGPDQTVTKSTLDAAIAGVETGGGSGGGGVSLEQRAADPLAIFRGAMSKRLLSSPVTIAWRGSSSTFGNNASTDDLRFVNKVMAKIRAAYPLASGSHPTTVLTLAAAVSSPPSGAGIFGVNAGISGSRSGSQSGATPYVTSTTRGQVAALPGLRVVIDMIGANDFAGRSDLAAFPVSVYKANLISEVTALKTLMGSALYTHIFVHSYPRFDSAAQAYHVAEWSEYLEALYEIQDLYEHVAVVNTADEWGSLGVTGAAGSDPWGYIDTDDIHMNDLGHDATADILFRKLTTPQFVGSTFAVAAPEAPTITTTSLSSMVVSAAFSQTLAYVGDPVSSWAVTAGTLPAGLSLNSTTGAITGTPTTAGAYSFTVTATNAAGSDTQAYSGTVVASGTAPTITTTTLSAMTQSSAFSQTLAYTGDTVTAWSVSAGSLPAGLSLNTSTGAITGTPTTAGAYSFTVQATNGTGSDTQAYSGTVASSSSFTIRTSDSFNRANATDVAGSATDCALGGTPLTWQTSVANTWAINSNALRHGTATAGGSFVPWSGADYEISAKIAVMTTTTGTSTYWTLDGRRSGLSTSGVSQYRLGYVANGTVYLYKTVSGTTSSLWNSSTGTVTTGDTLTLRMIGNQITVLKNGTILQTVTDSSVTTSVYAGLSRGSSNTGGWEDFQLAA